MRTLAQTFAAADDQVVCAPASCLHTCSEWWLDRASGENNAQLDWIAVPGRMRLKATSTPELGMLAHWKHTPAASARHGLPSGQPGHIAIVRRIDVDGTVWVRSTDMALIDGHGVYRAGSVATVPLHDVTVAMGLVVVGYARVIAGVLVVPKAVKPTPSPKPPSTSPASTVVTAVIANIKGNPVMPATFVRSDITKVFQLARQQHADAVYGAEIVATPSYYRSVWKALTAAFGFRFFAGDEVPISLNTAKSGIARVAVLIAHALHLLTRGIAKVSPNRYCNVLKASIPSDDHSTAFAVAFVNTHFNPQSTAKSHPEQIREQIHLVRVRVAELLAAGCVVIVGGDLNHTGTVVWANDKAQQVDLLPNVGDMAKRDLQLAVLTPVGVTASRGKHGAIAATSLHTDHPIRYGSVRLVKEAF